MPVEKLKSYHSRQAQRNFGRHSFLHRWRQSLKNSVAPVAKKFGRRTLVLRPRQSKKDSVALGAKTLRSAIIFASFAPDVKTFGRARRKKTSVVLHFCIVRASRKNIRSRLVQKILRSASFLHRSRQSLKLSVDPGAKFFWSAFIFGSFSSVAKMFRRARRRKSSFGVNFCIGRAVVKFLVAPSAKTLRSAAICASVFSVAKNCGWRAVILRPHQSQKLSVAPGKIKIGRRSLVVRSRQSKKLKSAGTFRSVAPVAKSFGHASRENNLVRFHSCCIHLSCKKIQAGCQLYYGRANRKWTSVGENLCFGHASRKSICRDSRKNALVGSRSCFGHLSCKKMQSSDYFVLVAPVTKIFGRARRKNIGRWSFLLQSRQSKQNLGRARHKKFDRWSLVLCSP